MARFASLQQGQLRANESAFVSSESPSSALTGLAIGAMGGALLASHGKDRRSTVLLRLAGLALIGYAARPAVAKAVRGAGERRRTVRLASELEIERSVVDVFKFFKNFENFPRVIGGLHSVIDYEDGRSHWEAYSPSGEIIAWDAVVTKYVPNHVIAWESVPQALVEMRGLIRFMALTPTRTRLTFEAKYTPLRSRLSDTIRAMMGPAPQARVVNDLKHARFYLESLKTQTAEVEPAPSAV